MNQGMNRRRVAFAVAPFAVVAVCTAVGMPLCPAPARAAVPADPDRQAHVIGTPTSFQVEPGAVELVGPRATRQIVVTGRYADGTARDLTALAAVTLQGPAVVDIGAGLFLTPKQNGTAKLVVTAGSVSAVVPVTVRALEIPQPISFRNQFVAALNVGGCNQGACHGTPSGKNGFKLSLRGYDPAADYLQLTRDVLGRRTDRLDPDASLVLAKAVGGVPHEGGQRFAANSLPARVMRRWLAEGLRDDPPAAPTVVKVVVVPGGRVLNAPARWQQLAVVAHFSDGSVTDVTRLSNFSSSDTAVAEVSPTGFVEFAQSGEVAILVRYLQELAPVRLTYLEPKPGFVWAGPPEHNFVDAKVFAKLRMLSIKPSDLCTDQEFVRRAYLDLCGILPTPAEVAAFLASPDPKKRAALIDTLLDRPEYADFWAMKWSDVLRSNRKTIQPKGVHVYQRWVRAHVEQNTPFSEVVRELLTANGSTFGNPPANYYRIARDPQNLAETTAQLFFGIRMQCAKCHNHPFERWTQDDYYSMAAFFARVRHRGDALEGGPTPQQPGAEEIYSDRGGEVTQPRTGKVMPPKFMGGAVPVVAAAVDRRQVLADWLTSADNPFFAKSVANRVWFHLTGKGIVDPVDDFRDSNPSANDELLDALAKDFAAHRFDVKHLIRTVMTSRTYQLSAQANEFNKDDAKYFSHAVTRFLTAEQLLDAICVATDVPEKFPGLPAGTRATQLPDGEINHPFLKAFGQPARELPCECERESDSNLAQALQLINGPTVNEKVRTPGNRLGKLLAATPKLSDSQVLAELYLATLSRTPTDGEIKAALDHVNNPKQADKRKAWEDVHWALLNSKEFLFRH